MALFHAVNAQKVPRCGSRIVAVRFIRRLGSSHIHRNVAAEVCRLRGGNDISEGLDQLRTILESRSIEEILAAGLHEFIDFLQGYLIVITDRLSSAFFGHNAVTGAQPPIRAAWPLAPMPQIPS